MPHVPVKELPDSLRAALKSVGYGKADISVEPSETASLLCSGSDGMRGFAILVDLASGASETHLGSWGGANAFNPGNAVDLDDRSHKLPPNGAVILGSSGGRATLARIKIHPSNAAPWLAPVAADLTDKDRAILSAYGTLKSGPYRQEALREARASEADVDALMKRGLLKRAANGATQITTEGKNTRRSLGRW